MKSSFRFFTRFSYSVSILIILFAQHEVFAQCPANEADLASGGTFSGNCTVNVGGWITITGDVVWTSGTLRINGNDGNLNLEGTMTIQNGATVRIDDNNDGDVDIQNGGVLIVEEGGTFYAREEIQVQTGSSMDISGTVYSETSYIDIDNGGSVVVNATGSLSTGGNDDFYVQGNLSVFGDVTIGNDLELNGATVNIGAGANVTMADEFFIDDSNVTISGTVQSTQVDDINVDGTSNVTFEDGADVTFNDMEFGTGDGATNVTINGGNITLLGEVDLNGGNDSDSFVVNGGTVNVTELEVIGSDGTFTVNPGGTMNVDNIDGVVYTDPDDLPSNIVLAGGSFGLNGVELPVELISFEGRLHEENRAVLLEWTTGSELNNEGFYLERSLDGKTFETLAFIEGHGTTTDIQKYSFIDQSIHASSYYRLRQIDFDGAYELSQMVYVSFMDGFEGDPINVYPNPTFGEVTLGGLRQEVYDLEMTDLSGKVVLSLTATSLEDSQSKINGHLNGSTKGVYLLKFTNPGHSEVIRLIVK